MNQAFDGRTETKCYCWKFLKKQNPGTNKAEVNAGEMFATLAPIILTLRDITNG